MSRKQKILQWTLFALFVAITLTVTSSFPNNIFVMCWEKAWTYFGLAQGCFLLALWLGESKK